MALLAHSRTSSSAFSRVPSSPEPWPALRPRRQTRWMRWHILAALALMLVLTYLVVHTEAKDRFRKLRQTSASKAASIARSLRVSNAQPSEELGALITTTSETPSSVDLLREAGGVVVLLTLDGRLHRLDELTGTLLWTNGDLDPLVFSPQARRADGMENDDGAPLSSGPPVPGPSSHWGRTFHAVNAADGSMYQLLDNSPVKMAEYDMAWLTGQGAQWLPDGTETVASRRGKTVVLDPVNGHTLHQMQADATHASGPLAQPDSASSEAKGGSVAEQIAPQLRLRLMHHLVSFRDGETHADLFCGGAAAFQVRDGGLFKGGRHVSGNVSWIQLIREKDGQLNVLRELITSMVASTQRYGVQLPWAALPAPPVLFAAVSARGVLETLAVQDLGGTTKAETPVVAVMPSKGTASANSVLITNTPYGLVASMLPFDAGWANNPLATMAALVGPPAGERFLDQPSSDPRLPGDTSSTEAHEWLGIMRDQFRYPGDIYEVESARRPVGVPTIEGPASVDVWAPNNRVERVSPVDSSSWWSATIALLLSLAAGGVAVARPWLRKKARITFDRSRVLGQGASGTTVYWGRFEGLLEVAVKAIDLTLGGLLDSARARRRARIAANEIELLVKVHHPNVVRYFGHAFREDGRDCFLDIALELCEGSLQDLVGASLPPMKDRPTALALDRVGLHVKSIRPGVATRKLIDDRQLVRDILEGLGYLHSNRMVHSDIKPQNILVSAEGRLKITDFGISRQLLTDERRDPTTAWSTGTPGWMAPEVAQPHAGRREERLLQAADTFSVGCVLYYLLTRGAHPFGNDPAQYQVTSALGLQRQRRQEKISSQQMDLGALVEPIGHHVTASQYMAADLITRLVRHFPQDRLTVRQALQHPYFWDDDRCLRFLQDASAFVWSTAGVRARQAVEATGKLVIRGDWAHIVHEDIYIFAGNHQAYQTDSPADLLRLIRNKYAHYHQLPQRLRTVVGPLPSGYLEYFSGRFPRLLMHVYNTIARIETAREHHAMRDYFGMFQHRED